MRANVTRAAEGFDRRSFTVVEILRMQDAGIISDEENFELIEGEIVPMHAKTHLHELIKSALNIAIARALPDRLWLGVESTIYLSANTFVEPDLVIYPRGIKLEEVKGSTSCWRSKSRRTSLTYDRGLKARLYARHGVNELWVIDAERRRTFVHSGPGSAGWRTIAERGRDEALTLAVLPGFSAQLGVDLNPPCLPPKRRGGSRVRFAFAALHDAVAPATLKESANAPLLLQASQHEPQARAGRRTGPTRHRGYFRSRRSSRRRA